MLRTDDSDTEELDGEWVTATFTEWGAAVDLAPFFRNNPPCSEYHVKAVVYHLHPADGPIKHEMWALRCLRQAGTAVAPC